MTFSWIADWFTYQPIVGKISTDYLDKSPEQWYTNTHHELMVYISYCWYISAD